MVIFVFSERLYRYMNPSEETELEMTKEAILAQNTLKKSHLLKILDSVQTKQNKPSSLRRSISDSQLLFKHD